VNTTRELAQRVADRISDHSFTVDVSAVRDYAPDLDQAEMDDSLYCYVVPMGRSDPPATEDPAVMGQLGRARKLRYFDVDVLLTRQFRGVNFSNATADPLVDLGDEIRELFDGQPLDGLSGRQVRCVATVPLVADPADKRRNRFTSLLALTFRVVQ